MLINLKSLIEILSVGKIMKIYRIIFLLIFCLLICNVKAGIRITSPCKIINKEEALLLDIDFVSNSEALQYLICKKNDEGKKADDLYSLSAIFKTVLGNCYYNETKLTAQPKLVTAYFYGADGDSCPDYSSHEYLSMGLAGYTLEKEKLFIEVNKILKMLRSHDKGFKKIFDSYPWYKYWFCDICKELNDSLSLINDKSKIKFSGFFENLPTEYKYLLYIEVGQEIWGLSLDYKNGELVLKDVSKAIR